MREHEWINVRVQESSPMGREGNAATRPFDDLRQTTPVWDDRSGRLKMSRSHDKGELLKGIRVNRDLPRKAVQRVTGAFDLIAVQIPVENCEIDAASGVDKAQLIDNQDVVTVNVMAQIAVLQRSSDLAFIV